MKIRVTIFVCALFVQIINVSMKVSELCLDCFGNVEATRCSFPFCASNSSCANKMDLQKYDGKLPKLSLVCRDEDSLTFTWTKNDGKYYFIEYFKSKPNESGFTQLNRCGYLTISGLDPDQNYTLYLYGISLSEKKIFRSNKVIEKTTKIGMKRTPVKRLNSTLVLTEDSYKAVVEWEPGLDFSCIYEILIYEKHQPEYTRRKIYLKKNPKTQYNLTNLEFGKTYHFSIMSVSRSGDVESSKKRLKIRIPSCWETFQNLTQCPPEQPTDLAVTEYPASHSDNKANGTSLSNLKLNWSKPRLEPEYYTVSFYSFNQSTNDHFQLSLNISGNQNSFLLEDIPLGDYYIGKLVAYSRGGVSPPAYIRNISQRKTNNNDTVFNNGTLTGNLALTTSQFELLYQWIGIAVVSLAVLIIMIIFRKRFKKALMHYFSLNEKIDDAIAKYATSESEDNTWELLESKLLIDKVIGFGAFGIVQKGYYYLEPNKKTAVAVKTLKAKPTADQVAQFYAEIEIMKSVPRHAHIVYLIGVVTKHRPSNPLMLVEYCARGDLQSYLRNVAFILGDSCSTANNTSSSSYQEDGTKFSNKAYDFVSSLVQQSPYVLQSKDLLSFARQIVVGMEFLSSLKVIHRDLAARNVLINEENTLKISDFGLSRDVYTDNMYKKVTAGKLPFRWMALESLTHQIYTTESDVWSFGIVLWEIVTLGANPYPTVNTEDLIPLLKRGYRMEKPVNCSEDLYQIMLTCWHTSPNLRKTFKVLREIFDRLLESEMQYISLEDAKKIDQNHYENLKTESEQGVSDRAPLAFDDYFLLNEKIDDIAKFATSECEDNTWELLELKLLIDKVIGVGEFGIVQKAKPTADQVAQFYAEIEIMKSVPRHTHIVYLIGVVTKHRPNNPLMLVEYCARGDLQSYLRNVAFILGDSCSTANNTSSSSYQEDGTKFSNKAYNFDSSLVQQSPYVLQSKDLLSFARQVVVGMEFLSSLKVIHRDLAARNVLINEENTLKISDFGLSRDVYTDNMYKKVTAGKLPFRWMALESLTHQIYTTESDVWSFGIVLWEIVTLGGNPYPTVNTEDLIPLLKRGYRMEKPVNCSEDLYQIMLTCWHTSPNLRKTFKELREIFDKLLESEMQYISLEDAKKIDQNHYENLKTESEQGVSDRYILRSNDKN